MLCVDLGLSVNWGECNIGANNQKGIGEYYAWGELTPKKYYDDNTYKYYKGIFNKIIKYNNNKLYGNNGYTDKLVTLEKIDDTAVYSLGSNWRMPTSVEVKELLQYTTQIYIKEENCIKFISKINGNSILIPISGLKLHNNIVGLGSKGGFWTSDLCINYPSAGNILELGINDYFIHDCIRSYGLPIRPIQEKIIKNKKI